MVVKSKVKYIQSLSHKKQRDAEGVFVAEGPKIINELLAAKEVELVELYALPGILDSVRADPSAITVIDQATLERISFLTTPNQILAVFKKPPWRRLEFSGRLTLMLDGIQDPGNIGTIIRCADWFGVPQVVCSEDCADVFGPKALQSSMGSIARVHVVYEDLEHVLSSNKSIHSCAATLDGKSISVAAAFTEGILVIGNESKGVSGKLLSLVRESVTIPGKGRAESLNAAVATGIILSHLVR